jgi:hypothetical protein
MTTIARRRVLGLAGGATAATAAVFLRVPEVRAQSVSGTPPVFNVRDPHPDATGVERPGARGDYNPTTRQGTDDRDAIRRAMAALADSGGGILYFPPGNYRASLSADAMPNIVTLVDNTHVTFDPAATLYLDPANTRRSYAMIRATRRVNVSVHGGRIVGDGAVGDFAGGSGAGVLVAGCDGAAIEGCDVSAVWGSGILVSGDGSVASRDIKVEDCVARNNLVGYGIASGETVAVMSSSSVNNWFGAYLVRGSAGRNLGVRIDGNHFEGDGVGVFVSEDAEANEGVNITSNTIASAQGDGVVGGGRDLTVSANVIRNNGGDGVRISSGTVSIIGNSCAENTGFGIRMAAPDSVVLGNRVRANAAGGLSTTGARSVVVDNVVS